MTDYLENKLIDSLLRGQSYAPPATLYFGLDTATSGDVSTSGTEVTGGAYARVAVVASLPNFAGTQGAGSTTASSGTSGTTSNNIVLTYAAPTANWGVINGMRVWDALTGGNPLIWAPLATPKTVNSGDPAPTFPIGSFSYQIDN